MKNLILIILTMINLKAMPLETTDQKLIYEYSEILPYHISNDTYYSRMNQIIDNIHTIDTKLQGYNESILYFTCKYSPKDSIETERQYKLAVRILEKGANPNLLNGTYQMPAFFLARNEQLFDLLLKHGADVNTHSPFMHIFYECTNYERVKKVLDLGLKTDYNVGYGTLYIHILLKSMDIKTLELLLDRIPEQANEYDNIGWCFVHYAAAGVRLDLINTLLDKNILLDKPTLSENEGYYGYDKGIKKDSNCLDIVVFLKSEYSDKFGEVKTNELINRLKNWH